MASSDLSTVAAAAGDVVPQVGGDENILQKHVSFFDRNNDGIIYPWETFQGFRAIGCGFLLSTASAFPEGKFPSLLFPIEVKNIQLAKHGSDSGVYDAQGRFVPSKFDEIFSKYAKKSSGHLTSEELKAMLKANREPKDYAGWVGALTEWKTLYFLCKDENGLLSKDTITALYDGSLFVKMEKDSVSAQKRV